LDKDHLKRKFEKAKLDWTVVDFVFKGFRTLQSLLVIEHVAGVLVSVSKRVTLLGDMGRSSDRHFSNNFVG